MELLMGKWLAVATITGAGVLLQIAGLLFAIGFLASSDLISTPSVSLTALVLFCAWLFSCSPSWSWRLNWL